VRSTTLDNDFTNVDMLTVEQAAARLGTTIRFVRRLVEERRIRYYKVGKYVRFHPDDIAEYIRAGQVDPVRPVLTYQRGVPVYA
jgi:excisionase family DNA binding protein